MEHLMNLPEEERELLEALYGKSIEEVFRDVVSFRGNRSTTSKSIGTRFHRHGDRRLNIEESEVRWTPAYQSYMSDGDDSEPYCSNCDEGLEMEWSYCPSCGRKLVTVYENKNGRWKEEGIS